MWLGPVTISGGVGGRLRPDCVQPSTFVDGQDGEILTRGHVIRARRRQRSRFVDNTLRPGDTTIYRSIHHHRIGAIGAGRRTRIRGVNGEDMAVLLVDLHVPGNAVVAIDGGWRPVDQSAVGRCLHDQHVPAGIDTGDACRIDTTSIGDVIVEVDGRAGRRRVFVEPEPLAVNGGGNGRYRTARECRAAVVRDAYGKIRKALEIFEVDSILVYVLPGKMPRSVSPPPGQSVGLPVLSLLGRA